MPEGVYSVVCLCKAETHTYRNPPNVTSSHIMCRCWLCLERVSQIQLIYTHIAACQYWFLSKYMSRLRICRNTQTHAHTKGTHKHTRTHTAGCQERRMTRWLNKHSHRLMGAWVMEKGSKWEKEWRHKRERRGREVRRGGHQEQIVVVACESVVGEIRSKIKRKGVGGRKEGKQQGEEKAAG